VAAAWAVLALAAAGAGRAAASDAPPAGSAAGTLRAHLRSAPGLAGDLGGRRPALESAGIAPSLFYNHFLGVLAAGGRDEGARARTSATGDFFLHAVLDRWLPWSGAEALLQVKAGFGRNVNPPVGALSDPFDDADGDVAYVPQLWLQQGILGQRIQLRVGYLDQQIALDRNAYANSEDRQFMATLLDNNSVTVPLALALGATLFVHPADWLDLLVGTADSETRPFSAGFDTAFNGFTTLFGYLEAGLNARLPSPRGPLPGSYRFGMVWDPRTKERFDAAPETTSGDAGAYVSVDQMLYRAQPGRPQGLGVFARYGYRDPDVNRIEHFWSVGLQLQGPTTGRPDDVVAFGMYQAHASSAFRHAQDPDVLRETGLEWYYAAQLLPWLTFTPDLQVIVMPGGRGSVADAVVLGFRWRVTF
jgi:porin